MPHSAAEKRSSKTSVGDYGVCVALFLFITHSTSGQVISGGQVWSVGKRNGLYDVNVSHPNSTGIKNCTSTTVLVILFFLNFPPTVIFSSQHRPFKYLFLNPSNNTSDGGGKLTYFGSVLFYFSFWCLFLIPYFKNCIFSGLLFCLFVFFEGGGVGDKKM